MVGPGVNADLVATHVFLDQDPRVLNDTRSNHKKSRLDLLRGQVIEELPA
jgi:hypothetical protein